MCCCTCLPGGMPLTWHAHPALTGTLTLNQLSVDKDTCMVMPPHSLDDVLKWGALSANIVSEEPIDVVLHEAYPGARARRCCLPSACRPPMPGLPAALMLQPAGGQCRPGSAKRALALPALPEKGPSPLLWLPVLSRHQASRSPGCRGIERPRKQEPTRVCVAHTRRMALAWRAENQTLWNDYTLQRFIPFNPTDKYTIAHVKNNKTGECTRIMKGAPQVRGGCAPRTGCPRCTDLCAAPRVSLMHLVVHGLTGDYRAAWGAEGDLQLLPAPCARWYLGWVAGGTLQRLSRVPVGFVPSADPCAHVCACRLCSRRPTTTTRSASLCTTRSPSLRCAASARSASPSPLTTASLVRMLPGQRANLGSGAEC